MEVNGVVYTGKVLNYYGDKFIIDLSDIKLLEETPFLFNHNDDNVVGNGNVFIVSDVSGVRLETKGSIFEETEFGKKISDIANKFSWKLSGGFYGGVVDYAKGGEIVNGVELEEGTLVLRGSVLKEVSVVAVPVDIDTELIPLSDEPRVILSVKALGENKNREVKMDFEKMLKEKEIELGEVRKELDEVKKNLEEKNKKIEKLSEETKGNIDFVCSVLNDIVGKEFSDAFKEIVLSDVDIEVKKKLVNVLMMGYKTGKKVDVKNKDDNTVRDLLIKKIKGVK